MFKSGAWVCISTLRGLTVTLHALIHLNSYSARRLKTRRHIIICILNDSGEAANHTLQFFLQVLLSCLTGDFIDMDSAMHILILIYVYQV